jgi:hypothetical protein
MGGGSHEQFSRPGRCRGGIEAVLSPTMMDPGMPQIEATTVASYCPSATSPERLSQATSGRDHRHPE